ncbi:MAG TPA: hypothetical protein ACFYD6_07330 [Candidatus Brocadiia bacterium]|nr:hypothetical protein [Candidatus Brocadiales bacterium]
MSDIFKFENKLTFPEKCFVSGDKKTIFGETLFRDVLFLDYRDTEAGSNPREYIGLKKTNLEIIKSILKDQEMFRFLHSGMIVSATGVNIDSDYLSISYETCCLTNGNQTRFIILILSLLKQYSTNTKSLENFVQRSFNEFLNHEFKNNNPIRDFLRLVKFPKVSEVRKFLCDNNKYFTNFNALALDKLLNSKIRITINSLDKITESIDNLDEYATGTLIANANNDTQNVKVDDIFGSKHKKFLEETIFRDFIAKYGSKVEIEYRFGEIIGRKPKVHILTLLRPVIATGIFTKYKEIFRLSNQRAPIYNIFIRLIRNKEKGKVQTTIKVVSKIIPLLYSIREDIVINQLKLQRDIYYREYVEKAINGELKNTSIRNNIKFENNEPSEDTKRVLRNITNYNIEHIFPVVVFRIRNLIKDSENRAELVITKDKEGEFLKSIINAIYKRYIELKLIGSSGSITTEIRSDKFFESGAEAYETLKDIYKFGETNCIKDNQYLIQEVKSSAL